jgi:hypothetical protein
MDSSLERLPWVPAVIEKREPFPSRKKARYCSSTKAKPPPPVPRAFDVARIHGEAGHVHRFTGGGDRHGNHARNPAGIDGIDECQGIEIPNGSGDAGTEAGRIKPLDSGDAAAARAAGEVERVGADGVGAYDADAGDCHAMPFTFVVQFAPRLS